MMAYHVPLDCSAKPMGIPYPLTSLVGRETEVRAIRDLLTRARLLTAFREWKRGSRQVPARARQ